MGVNVPENKMKLSANNQLIKQLLNAYFVQLWLTQCLPVSTLSTTSFSGHFLLFHLFFFRLHASCWGAGWDSFCQWTPVPMNALYTSGIHVERQQARSSIPLHIDHLMYILCLMSFFYFFIFLINFYWSIDALQCFTSFCCAAK